MKKEYVPYPLLKPMVDENKGLVIEKYLERKQKDMENNFKNHIYVSLPLVT